MPLIVKLNKSRWGRFGPSGSKENRCFCQTTAKKTAGCPTKRAGRRLLSLVRLAFAFVFNHKSSLLVSLPFDPILHRRPSILFRIPTPSRTLASQFIYPVKTEITVAIYITLQFDTPSHGSFFHSSSFRVKKKGGCPPPVPTQPVQAFQLS